MATLLDNALRSALRERIAAYCADAGWQVAEILGEESGCLPVVGNDPAY